MLSRRKSAPFLRDGKAYTNAAVLLLLELKKRVRYHQDPELPDNW
jgi:hypothetical protein